MKRWIFVTAICLALFIVGASPARAQQVVEGYTFVRGPIGTQVCLGKWVPPKDVALSGYCDGQVVDVAQLTAVSAGLSADRLNQTLSYLSAIDQRLAISNEQVERLIEATVKAHTSIDEQVRLVSELLHEAVARRFDALREEILADDRFREELSRLKEEILKEVEKHYTKKPAQPAK